MTGASVEISAAGLESAELLAALHGASFARSAAEPWSLASARSLLSAPGVMALIAAGLTGASADRQPCGLAVARCGPDDAEILALGVLPQVQRQGIATRLMAALLKLLAATDIRSILLEVAVDNQAARALYAVHGFSEVGLRRGYYRRQPGPPIDALVLARPIDLADAAMRGPGPIPDGQQFR